VRGERGLVLLEPSHTGAKGAQVLDADPPTPLPEFACAIGHNRCNGSDRNSCTSSNRNRYNCSRFPPMGSQERFKLRSSSSFLNTQNSFPPMGSQDRFKLRSSPSFLNTQNRRKHLLLFLSALHTESSLRTKVRD